MRKLSRKQVMDMRTEFCKENKLSQRYYKQRNTLVVDFRAIERFSLDFYKRTNQKDLARIKEKAFVNPKVLEQLFYEELLQHISSNLSSRENKVFKLLIDSDLSEKSIAKRFHISARTIRRYVNKIRQIVRKYYGNKKIFYSSMQTEKNRKYQKAKKEHRKYYIKNRKKLIKKSAEYNKNKRKKDITYRILDNLRTRLRHALKDKTKSKHTIQLIGCSILDLKQHLENQFRKGMSWENYGKWQIDHIKPCASFDLSKPEEQRKCFNYTNLQPLWADENFKKHTKF